MPTHKRPPMVEGRDVPHDSTIAQPGIPHTLTTMDSLEVDIAKREDQLSLVQTQCAKLTGKLSHELVDAFVLLYL